MKGCLCNRCKAWSLAVLGCILLAAAACLSGCGREQRQEIAVDDPRVSKVIVADPVEVYEACYQPGGLDDQGHLISRNAEFGGCFFRWTKVMWINRACNLLEAFRHELCHAIGELSDKDCDDRHPVTCPAPYRFSQGSEGYGGHH